MLFYGQHRLGYSILARNSYSTRGSSPSKTVVRVALSSIVCADSAVVEVCVLERDLHEFVKVREKVRDNFLIVGTDFNS